MQQGGKHAGISRTGLGTSEPREGEKVCDFCFFKCRLCGHAVVKL